VRLTIDTPTAEIRKTLLETPAPAGVTVSEPKIKIEFNNIVSPDQWANLPDYVPQVFVDFGKRVLASLVAAWLVKAFSKTPPAQIKVNEQEVLLKETTILCFIEKERSGLDSKKTSDAQQEKHLRPKRVSGRSKRKRVKD
jgi:hypothetical protein